MASVDAQWMPVTGRHKVDIGSSLARTLKARKGIVPPKRGNLPDRDFYSFRYNFKPESIDPDKPGSIEVKRTKESTSVTVERPSTQARESHLFKGAEQPVKEYDCVLIYDEDLAMTERFRRRRLQLGKIQLPQLLAAPQPADNDVDFTNQLERDLIGLEDAEGEPDDEFEEANTYIRTIRPPHTTVPSDQKDRRFRAEEEEEEEEELILAASKTPSPVSPPKPKNPTNQQEPKSKPKLKSKELSRTKAEIESHGIVDSVFEEVLDFGIPTHAMKRQKLSPVLQKAPPITQLALPGVSTSVMLPSSRPPPPPKEEDDSEEDDWDPVVGGEPQAENDAEEIDLDAFEQEMEQQLEGLDGLDEDILAAAMSEPTLAARRPMSLNQFAGGGQLSQDEDSTSSSEDSDED
ncbi:hypothetical protein JVU11DRAFT_1315 [Chiua virens]|nr:hypothetical protein JVU11DRAFT_1315 [Chiua virens]